MNKFLIGEKSHLLSPAVFLFWCVVLAVVWLCMSPAAVDKAFNQNGMSVFELATIPFFIAIVPLVWWKCPFSGSKTRKVVLCSAVSVVAVMAVAKQLDLHLAFISWLYPDVVANFRGTPFKMRFLTNGTVPVGAKFVSLSYFILFFGVFAAGLLYYAKDLIIGFFKRNPVAWSVCFFGGSGVMVQVFDRLPAWYRKSAGISRSDFGLNAFTSFCTVFEEGCEMLMAIFCLVAIYQSWLLIDENRSPSDFTD